MTTVISSKLARARNNRIDYVVNKYRLVPDMISLIIDVDPTPELKYLDWIARYMSSDNTLKCLKCIKTGLSLVQQLSLKIDINQYAPSGLIEYVSTIHEKYIEDINRIESDIKFAIDPNLGHQLLYKEGSSYLVACHDYESALYYGTGTKWCTTNSGAYLNYSDSPLFILKSHGRKYQLQLPDVHKTTMCKRHMMCLDDDTEINVSKARTLAELNPCLTKLYQAYYQYLHTEVPPDSPNWNHWNVIFYQVAFILGDEVFREFIGSLVDKNPCLLEQLENTVPIFHYHRAETQDTIDWLLSKNNAHITSFLFSRQLISCTPELLWKLIVMDPDNINHTLNILWRFPDSLLAEWAFKMIQHIQQLPNRMLVDPRLIELILIKLAKLDLVKFEDIEQTFYSSDVDISPNGTRLALDTRGEIQMKAINKIAEIGYKRDTIRSSRKLTQSLVSLRHRTRDGLVGYNELHIAFTAFTPIIKSQVSPTTDRS